MAHLSLVEDCVTEAAEHVSSRCWRVLPASGRSVCRSTNPARARDADAGAAWLRTRKPVSVSAAADPQVASIWCAVCAADRLVTRDVALIDRAPRPASSCSCSPRLSPPRRPGSHHGEAAPWPAPPCRPGAPMTVPRALSPGRAGSPSGQAYERGARGADVQRVAACHRGDTVSTPRVWPARPGICPPAGLAALRLRLVASRSPTGICRGCGERNGGGRFLACRPAHGVS